MKLKGFGTNLEMKVEGELGNGNEGENVFPMKKVHYGCMMRVHDKTKFCECVTWWILRGEQKRRRRGGRRGFGDTSKRRRFLLLYFSKSSTQF